ncbi:MAG: dihydrodipicolinate synthase family protein [Candidatus Pelagibacter sp. TMED275]|nr:MAG: dihydrodipicolinate synthase family protein [Candidatus Pelagibacter sp. TMED275]|tara:strand:- start:1721 stop:2605 length:885 start_codon:yes stop_codon:yes gene_type:complete
MTKVNGIFAATMSILDENLSLNVKKTINHGENLIKQGCHGVALFGSTGQSQLISISEKLNCINELSKSMYKNQFIIGTGINSLNETINLMKISITLGFKRFLIMPPAYYKYADKDVIKFYSEIINNVPNCEIILYNFEKLSGYKFSIECVKRLAKKFPNQIIGVKDSSYNLYENLKIDNFSILPGSEIKLLKGLELGCSGIITATCNVTASLSRKVFDDFIEKKQQTQNEKLCRVRKVFDQFNLISGLHSIFSKKDKIYKNLIPPLDLLNQTDEDKLLGELKNLNFNMDTKEAA